MSEAPTNNNDLPTFDGEDDYQYSDEGMTLEEQKEEAMKKYEAKWLKERGINPYAHILGQSLHKKTVKSYRDLGMEPSDNPYYASRRWFEKMKRNMANMKTPPKIYVTINHIKRLRDEKTGKEWLVYDYTESLEDAHGNEHHQEFKNAGAFELVEGKKVRDPRSGRVTGTEISAYKRGYDFPFSAKAVDNILKKNTTKEKPYLSIGKARTKGRLFNRSVSDGNNFVVKNIDDFKTGTYEQLKLLCERALSEERPSLHKLKQPVMADPANSLWRKNLPIQPVIAAPQEE